MKPVQLILGDNEFLAERARHEIVATLRAENPGVEVALLSSSEATPNELALQLSPSLFGDDKVVVITRAQDAGKDAADAILAAAVDLAPGMTLVVQHSGGGRQKQLATKLQKIADVWEANTPKARDLSKFVAAEFARHQLRVTPDVNLALLESVGSDLREISSAVSQLVADTGGDVTVASVRTYYEGVAEVSGFDIADDAVQGKTARAVASTRRALQLGMSPVQLASALANKVDAIARMYSTRGKPDVSRLGMHPYAVQLTHQVARRWSGEAVSEAVIIVAELDAAVKGQAPDPEFAIEDAVRRIAELAR
ncbi:DNA polymerase III subunit delta [Corynebacterium sp. 13CS0277]|uniref:DNA polymerase III subunit delta n=1 Tax=Corynebacterium sp. 13CS0277 TaxID=2071994 RepID=UPI000D03D087|nr:DNA polymerase III subunit delta [Corynebacterium sp. 13CS0277]PRQ11668.1 DNA polymerase III subunit delta [Corynebacterium sp. 13CS0277]